VPKPKLYPALKFFNEDGHGPKEDAYIIMEGRAADNGIGGRETPTESWELDIQDKYVVVNNTLHISANGNVMPGCDFSFDRIDSESVGNVLTESLQSILQRQVNIYKLKEAA
jgi:hypothetical protein